MTKEEKTLEIRSSGIAFQLQQMLKKFKSAPVLFIGSGISRRYLGLPTWKELLIQLSARAGENYDQIHTSVNGHYPSIATELSKRLSVKWFSEKKFSKSRSKFGTSDKTIDDIIKIEAAQLISEITEINKDYITEIEEFKKVIIDGVITTNYDNLLERIFDHEMTVYIGQKAMMTAPIQRINEIYKIHGSIDEPSSMILTKDDYIKFERTNVYLSAILTQIFAEHPIVFIGYSLDDENIRKILGGIVSCMDEEKVEDLKDRFFFVQRGSENEITASHLYFSDPVIQIPINKIVTDDYAEVYRGLQGFKRGLSAKILRLFKETAHKIALEHSPELRLATAQLADSSSEDLQFIFGHGLVQKGNIKGITGIERFDIVKNALEVEDTFTDEDIFTAIDKNFIKFRAIIPYGKYFVKTGRAKFKKGRWEITTPTSWTASQREKILKYFTSEPSDFRSYEVSETSLKAFKENNSSISDIKRNFADRAEAIKRVSWLEFDEIDIDEFQHLLTDGIEQFSGKKSTEYMKAIKLFDFMKYIYKKKRPKKAKLVKIEYTPT